MSHVKIRVVRNCECLHTLVLLDRTGLKEEAWQSLRHDDTLLITLLYRHTETLDGETDAATADCHQEVPIYQI
jgi:hypothetical protein